MIKTLIIEDDISFSELLTGFLVRYDHDVISCAKIKPALKILAEKKFDLILVDYRLPDGTGLEILKAVREQSIIIPIIMMTSFNDVRTAVKSIQLGAFDYIIKPVNPDELLLTIKKALSKEEGKIDGNKINESDFIKGNSIVANKLYQHISLVAPTDMSVIIQGESGTGKEYVARTLHNESKRSEKPFISIDCGALSKDLAASELFGHVKGSFTGALNDKKGQFETAHGGTLFLDEVGNLSYEVQVKLLRALQERVVQPIGSTKQIAVDVRIITATNDDLVQIIKQGEFREDLYHRLNQFKIQLPALRDRGDDLKLFIEHFINLANKELDRNVKEVDKYAKKLLLNYDWPGNLRELNNVIKRMVLLTEGEVANIDALPEEMILAVNEPAKNFGSDLKANNEINEKNLIIEALSKTKFNKSKTAKMLNIDRKTLYAKLERYGIE
ncbi:sigma-54-dependent Fis family transcriptional regulator [Pedobacter psychrophilus]|uniref:Sigma-54-dependent Fis family transcriptional regulator n=1 Tax=Pedobacter psychrophilus TaxID=1826909 RepID=A0A179DAN6_9SPHI|nr:sigma-54 dependent transcriptional regulator [Pedobacter psychrophilus]OAQ38115.1 sigma-54-dependent Fis family transcriptional regulator [Pedobacter psychrophilus]